MSLSNPRKQSLSLGVIEQAVKQLAENQESNFKTFSREIGELKKDFKEEIKTVHIKLDSVKDEITGLKVSQTQAFGKIDKLQVELSNTDNIAREALRQSAKNNEDINNVSKKTAEEINKKFNDINGRLWKLSAVIGVLVSAISAFLTKFSGEAIAKLIK